MCSDRLTLILFILFLFALFLIPWNKGKFELFTLGKWKNAEYDPNMIAGYCGPDFSKFSDFDNVAVRCVGNGNMTYRDCNKLRDIKQICGVNRDTGETYPCKYYNGVASKRCIL